MSGVLVHPRIAERHPELSNQDVLDAWAGSIRAIPRLDGEVTEYIVIGSDRHGRLVEMVARDIGRDTWLIYHAFTPPTRKAL